MQSDSVTTSGAPSAPPLPSRDRFIIGQIVLQKRGRLTFRKRLLGTTALSTRVGT